MENVILTTLVFVVVAVLGASIFMYMKNSPKKTGTEDLASLDLSKRIDALSQNVAENLNSVTKTMLGQLNDVTGRVDSRLKENLEMMQRQHRNVGERLDNAAKVISAVNSNISKLEESNKRVHDVAKDIASLQDILKAPKLRGGLGELFLEELLSQIFSRDQYSLQYRFKTGDIVDAVIHLRDDNLVCVDAKFPLENFKKMVECKDPKEQDRMKRLFVSDVKKHIDDISRKYILPDEGTFEFALMYIPAENVYYETIVKDEADESISHYGITKRVIPVSPNSFNVYLHTILMGLKGMQIEKSAKEILATLSRLKVEFGKFGKDFELVGAHLSHASSSYDKSEKSLQRFSEKLLQVETTDKDMPEIPLPLVPPTSPLL